MARITMAFTFNLPYHINIVDGQVTKDIVIPLPEKKGKVIIHPPSASEKRIIQRSLEKSIWCADMVNIDIEIETPSLAPFNDLVSEFEPIAKEHLNQFLRYCRAESGQFLIDLRERIDSWDVAYVNEDGQKHRGPHLTLWMVDAEHNLDDTSWKAVYQDLIGKVRVPFYVEALLDAQLYRKHGDYRMAVLNAAIGIESILKRYLREKLTQHLKHTSQKTPQVVKDFLKEISNRFLIKVVLPQFLSLDQSILDGCWRTLDLRNNIVHAETKSVPSEVAKESIRSLQELMSVDDIIETLRLKRTPKSKEGEINEKS